MKYTRYKTRSRAGERINTAYRPNEYVLSTELIRAPDRICLPYVPLPFP